MSVLEQFLIAAASLTCTRTGSGDLGPVVAGAGHSRLLDQVASVTLGR